MNYSKLFISLSLFIVIGACSNQKAQNNIITYQILELSYEGAKIANELTLNEDSKVNSDTSEYLLRKEILNVVYNMADTFNFIQGFNNGLSLTKGWDNIDNQKSIYYGKDKIDSLCLLLNKNDNLSKYYKLHLDLAFKESKVSFFEKGRLRKITYNQFCIEISKILILLGRPYFLV